MAEEFSEVFRLHLLCDHDAPGRVREELGRTDGIDSVRDEARLVASELVSNAVLHSGCRPGEHLDVLARTSAHRLEISVHDPGRSGTMPEVPQPREVGGLGLAIVESIADSWGVARSDGRLVWARLSLEPDPFARLTAL